MGHILYAGSYFLENFYGLLHFHHSDAHLVHLAQNHWCHLAHRLGRPVEPADRLGYIPEIPEAFRPQRLPLDHDQVEEGRQGHRGNEKEHPFPEFRECFHIHHTTPFSA